MKDCPPDKIRNPTTGRCVNKTGIIGKKLLKKSAKPKTLTPKKSAKPKTPTPKKSAKPKTPTPKKSAKPKTPTPKKSANPLTNIIKKKTNTIDLQHSLVQGKLYNWTNPKYGTEVHVGLLKKGKYSVFGKDNIYDSTFYYDCNSSQYKDLTKPNKNIPLDLVLVGLYSTDVGKTKPPRGYARQVLSEQIKLIKAENKYIGPNSIICLEADGNVQGSYNKLVKLYQRMGFKIVGVKKEGYNNTELEKMCKNQKIIKGSSSFMACRLSQLKL